MNRQFARAVPLMLALALAAVAPAADTAPASLDALNPLARLTTPDAPAPALGLTLTDLGNKPHTLGADTRTATVVVFLSTDCPVSHSAIPELNRLAAIAKDKQMEFYGVMSETPLTREDAVKYRAEHKIAFPVLFDGDGTLAAALRPTHTPHCFVVLPGNTLAYAGRVNDALAPGKAANAPRVNDLEAAIAQLAAGKAVTTPRSDPIGCLFDSWQRKPRADSRPAPKAGITPATSPGSAR